MRYASFRNRAEAGALLATRLQTVVVPPAVVAGIPRGGLAVALPIAEALGAPLTMALARKLTVPVAPELALGAVDEDGELLTDPGLIASVGASPADIARAHERARVEIEREREHYGAPPLACLVPGATVVLVDDGLATGLTMRVAVAYAKRHGARSTVVAAPCASRASLRRLEREADRVVTLLASGGPFAVGAFYEDFRPVPDAEVLELLDRAAASARPATAAAGGRAYSRSDANLLASKAGSMPPPRSGDPMPDVQQQARIRPLDELDIGGIVSIDERISGTYRPDFWEQRVVFYLRRDPESSRVAEVDGKVVGFMLGDVRAGEFGLEEPSGWIERFGIHPEYRGRDLAKQMFEAIVGHFRAKGAATVRTLVDGKETNVVGFLKALGFAPSPLQALEISLKK